MIADAVRTVDVACAVVHAGDRSLTVRIAGHLRTIERRQVIDWKADQVTVPEWLAVGLGCLALDRCLTDEDLAKRFGASRDWVYRNIERLVAEAGFPKPVSHIGRRRYAPAKVDAWFARDPDAAAAMVAEQDRTEAAARGARRETARAAFPAAQPRLGAHFSEPRDDDDAWRAALADEYGSAGR